MILFMKSFFGPLLITLFVSLQAHSIEKVDITGEVGLSGSLWYLPTGEQGNSNFDLSTFFLGISAELHSSNYFQLVFEADESEMKLREVYVDLASIFSGMRVLRMGLLPQPWLKSYYEIWDYRFLDRTTWGLLEKWNYQRFSDYGVSYMSELALGRGEWAITIVNGKEEKNRGPHKEFSFFVRWNDFANWSLSANYSRGSYDKYDDGDDLKERAQFLAVYFLERMKAGVELLYSQDSNFAFADNGMAEGVETTLLPKGLLAGVGASVFAVVETGPKAETFMRVDYLDAAQGEGGKTLLTTMLGLGYRLTEDLRLASMIDYTIYGDDFAPGSRDTSKFVIAAQVLF